MGVWAWRGRALCLVGRALGVVCGRGREPGAGTPGRRRRRRGSDPGARPGGPRGLPFVLAARIRAQGHRVGLPHPTLRPIPARVPARALPGLGCARDARPPALRLLAAGRGAMELSMKKFTVRRFFSVYLRKKSRSKSSSLSRLEVKALPGSAQDVGPRRTSSGHVEPREGVWPPEPFSQSRASHSPQTQAWCGKLFENWSSCH